MFTIDAGSKALAAEVPAPIAIILGSAESSVALGPSEEHLPFAIHSTSACDNGDGDGDGDDAARPARGSVLYVVPKHVRKWCRHVLV